MIGRAAEHEILAQAWARQGTGSANSCCWPASRGSARSGWPPRRRGPRTATGMPDALTAFATQLATIRRERGRAEEPLDAYRGYVEAQPHIPTGRARACSSNACGPASRPGDERTLGGDGAVPAKCPTPQGTSSVGGAISPACHAPPSPFHRLVAGLADCLVELPLADLARLAPHDHMLPGSVWLHLTDSPDVIQPSADLLRAALLDHVANRPLARPLRYRASRKRGQNDYPLGREHRAGRAACPPGVQRWHALGTTAYPIEAPCRRQRGRLAGTTPWPTEAPCRR